MPDIPPNLKAKGPIIFRQRVGSCQQQALLRTLGRVSQLKDAYLGPLVKRWWATWALESTVSRLCLTIGGS